MPRLWTNTIEAHRAAVRDAAIAATAALVARHGIRGVSMSGIAEEAGIGRATLYKYFPDLDAILGAWQDRQLDSHLAKLAAIGDASRPPVERLGAALEAYAELEREFGGSALAELLQDDDLAARGRAHVRAHLAELIADAAAAGDVRADVAPDELAGYALAALGAAGSLDSEAAVGRLVTVTLDALRRGPGSAALPR